MFNMLSPNIFYSEVINGYTEYNGAPFVYPESRYEVNLSLYMGFKTFKYIFFDNCSRLW